MGVFFFNAAAPAASGSPGSPASPGSPEGPPDQSGEGGGDAEGEVDVATRTEKPRRFKVLFHNDDYTTMEFVIECLVRFFHKSQGEATHIMLTVHTKGRALVGVYTRDVAETKVEAAMAHAKERGMPLLVTSEPE